MEIALYNAVGVILGLLVDRERTDQRRLREAESYTAIGKALLGVAHDMKTPLVAIGGFARSVQKRMDRTNPDHRKLDIVLAETERLERMIKGMLDFSRPLTLDQSREDLNQAIMESLPIVENVAAEKEVKVELRLEEGPLLVNSDQRRMKQVIINLLINAIEASEQRETVMVCTRRERENVVLEVSDHGCGIPGERKEEVFIPFFSTKKGGTGLGLAIAKKVVDAHGGEISFRPNSGGAPPLPCAYPRLHGRVTKAPWINHKMCLLLRIGRFHFTGGRIKPCL
jgi:signal transduction histidine kinase